MALLEQHDLERYRQFVADVDMPNADKDELIGIGKENHDLNDISNPRE